MMVQRFSYFFLFLLVSLLFCSCKEHNKKIIKAPTITEDHNFKFSLGQWTFHKDLFAGKMKTIDFISITKELGFDGVDFVNQFFKDKANDLPFLDSLKTALATNNLEAAMIMIDGEGDLGDLNENKRKQAIEDHKKWIYTAKHLGCESIRVNAHGEGNAEQVLNSCAASIGELADIAKKEGILVLIENHGGYSSDGNWLLSLMKQLEAKNVALLPDFDNWCIERENGERWNATCINEYDRYIGMAQLLPYAKSLSIKSFGFDQQGNEIKTDYKRVFKMVNEHGYRDYLGIEYEGDGMSPKEGVVKTLALVKKILIEQ